MRCPPLTCPLHSKRLAALALAVALQASLGGLAQAADIGMIGVFPGRGAVLVIDGSAPQTLRIGQKAGDVTLVSVDKDSAVIEEAGRRRTLGLGQHITSGKAPASRNSEVTLAADGRGHFIADSTVNGGGSVRFLVDTGATMVAIPGAEARRLGLDFTRAERGVAQTANGPAPVYRVKLDSVKVGEIELLNVDAMVIDGGGLAQPLLGMSFLNRLEMRREGDSMTLKRRY